MQYTSSGTWQLRRNVIDMMSDSKLLRGQDPKGKNRSALSASFSTPYARKVGYLIELYDHWMFDWCSTRIR